MLGRPGFPGDEAELDTLATRPIEDALCLVVSQAVCLRMLAAERKRAVITYAPRDLIRIDAAIYDRFARLRFGCALTG
jgi:hypothetical protein